MTILDPKQTFASLADSIGLDPRLQKAVARLGHARPTLVQSKCLPLALQAGRDLLVRAQTGSGKTLAYCLPLLEKILRHVDNSNTNSNSQFPVVSSSSSCDSVRAIILVPTRELCAQVHQVLCRLIYYCDECFSLAVLSVGMSSTVQDKPNNNNNKTTRAKQEEWHRQQAMLRDRPNVVIATPNGLLTHVHSGALNLKTSPVETVVVDEADLLLSFGYENDMNAIVKELPRIYQGFLMSATLSPDIESLKKIVLHSPVILKLEQDDTMDRTRGRLKQFYLNLPKEDKNLVIYVFLKLGLLRGKGLFFVNTTDAAYQLKLFLEQFHIRSAVLNAELPFRSRLNIIEQFNLGNFEYLIATDASSDVMEEEHDGEGEKQGEDEHNDTEAGVGDDDLSETEQRKRAGSNQDEIGLVAADGGRTIDDNGATKPRSMRKSLKRRNNDVDYGVSRGLDFRGVSFVLNVDMPVHPRAYAHRVGRTARGGAKGVALTLVESKSFTQHEILRAIQQDQPRIRIATASTEQLHVAMPEGNTGDSASTTHRPSQDQEQPMPLDFDLREIEGFRYRVEDISRGITRSRIRDARASELRAEMLNSDRLLRHFAENPVDLQLLRHDRVATHSIHIQEHLKHVPKYLLPRGMEVARMKKKRKKKKRQMQSTLGQRSDPLRSFDSQVGLDGVAADDEDEDGEDGENGAGSKRTGKDVDPYAEFMQDDGATEERTDEKPSKKAKMSESDAKKVFLNTRDRTGRSTAGRVAWKQRHHKGQFSNKKRKSERKHKEPLGI